MSMLSFLSHKFQNFRDKFKKQLVVVGFVLLVGILVGGSAYIGYRYYPYSETQNKYVAFVSEVYDQIQEHHWQEMSNKQLSTVFGLGVQKLEGQSYVLKKKDRQGVRRLVAKVVSDLQEDKQRKEFVLNLSQLVLNSLEPRGKSKLFTRKQTQELAEKVQNVNKEDNPYENLGVDEDASEEDIEKAYQEKVEELTDKEKEAESKEVEEEIEKEKQKVERSKQILADEQSRELYNVAGAHSTVFGKKISRRIYYLKITRFAPRTLAEFVKVANFVEEDQSLDSLIIDLRGNIGGNIDILQKFLGPFIGKNEYAYEFFHQGERVPYKTTEGWLPSLVKYKKVVVLVDEKTQSTAEVMAATLKKYNVGVLVGKKTKGWGTVEKVYNLETQLSEEETYSLFLVHSVTLRNDERPIQDNGVVPVIKIDSPNWKKQLRSYFEFTPLVEKVEAVWDNPPF